MPNHSHEFVENYIGPVGYGLEREIDESTLKVYLQKFSDDELLDIIIARMEDQDLEQVFDLLSQMLSKHLDEEEYHRLFLK